MKFKTVFIESMIDNIKKKYYIDKPEKADPSHSNFSIGFSQKNNKWYGWSHRAIFGFGIGDKIYDDKYGDEKTPYNQHGEQTIKTLDDAKKSAINFAKSVS